jgi:dihydroorotase
MRDRTLAGGTRSWGRSVHVIQQMPPAHPQNTDQTMSAVTRVPARPQEGAG